MLTFLAQLTWRQARRVIIGAVVVLVAFGFFGFQAFPALISGGFDDPDAEATRATTLINDHFGGVDNLVLVVNAPAGSLVSDADVLTRGATITKTVTDTAGVTDVVSYFEVRGTAAGSALLSSNRKQALIIAKAAGTEAEATEVVKDLRDRLDGDRGDGVTVWVGGSAAASYDISNQVVVDLGRAEAVAVPLTAILLIFVFGSMVAALLPLAVGGFAVLGAFFAIFVITRFTDVSVFSINLITGMGLGLAVDYSLLITSRFREELSHTADRAGPRGSDPERERVRLALTTTMRTAGRTVLFTGLAVSLAMLVLLVFPMPFLRSFGFGGVAVVVVAMIGALVVLPAMLGALGTRVDALRIRPHRPVRSASAPSPFWRRVATAVLKAPWLALPVIIVLGVMASPLRDATFGSPDDRSLNTDAQSRLVGDALRNHFPGGTDAAPVVLITGKVSTSALRSYVVKLSRLDGVDSVQSAAGSYADGTLLAPAQGTSLTDGDVTMIAVNGPKDGASTQARELTRDIRALAPPSKTNVAVGGYAAQLLDNQTALVDRLPLAAGLIVLTTLVLVFLFTGSVLLPLKAVLMNVITLSAVVGSMTWIFQEGHLSGLLGFTKGPIDTSMPILLFCIAFGLSMDYELFLIARIKEFHDHGADLHESVAGGLASTGRLTTMAAGVLAVTFAAFGTSRVTFLQLFGIGTGLAVVVDATLVRGVLVPAFMRIAGPANWWAPRPLRALHRVIGLQEATTARRRASRAELKSALPRRALQETD